MTAFFFGDASAPLYGYYYAVAAQDRARPAIVLCAPFGEEAVRAFKPMTVLADRLARRGSPVLRFDYAGSGDSAGACETVRLAGMANDVLEAHQELSDMSLAPRIVWIGLRLGAAAAVLAAEERPRGLAGVLAWEPVTDGPAYLAQMRATQKANLQVNLLSDTGVNEGAVTEYLGFPVSETLRSELEAYSAAGALENTSLRRLTVAPAVGADSAALEATFTEAAKNVAILPPTADAPWNSDDAMNAYSVPTLMIDQIVDAIGAWR
ncbi:MAG: alpha/beta hydrolase [Pseudomonadota bacterium]